LRVGQSAWRLWYRVYRPDIDCSPAPALRTRNSEWHSYLEREPALISPIKVVFLNVEADISDVSIWNDQKYAKLWLYNLHYFDDLNAKDSSNRVDWHKQLIQRWLNENPAAKGDGWEPYPTSLRIVNWIKWSLSGNEPTEPITQSLAVQARWLSKNLEFHILGNHLLANAKALCFAGLYFSGQEADVWYRCGVKILETQLEEQVLPDGGHFELSPMYHLIVLEDLLDLAQLMKVYERQVPPYLCDAIHRMLGWSRVMRHPDGEIPFFNDAAFGVAVKPTQLDLYAQALGFDVAKPEQPITHLCKSGYIKMVSDNAVVFADMAPVGPDYLPGHAHADTLSFELSLGERRIIVNGGTSVYGNDHERQRQRGTRTHSTVTIDGENSSEVWGGFRVARRAKANEIEVDDQVLSACAEHDGYARLNGSPKHRRGWHLSQGKLEVLDVITGSGDHDIEINFHLAPGLIPRIDNSGAAELCDEKSGVVLCRVISSEPKLLSVQQTTWHPRFGATIPSWTVVIRTNQELPFNHNTIFEWRTLH
jgi:uncharacterized heparinase superfamily protein